MRKRLVGLVAGMVMFGMVGVVNASTFTDTFESGGTVINSTFTTDWVILLQGGGYGLQDGLSYTFDILQYGYNPDTMKVDGISMYLQASDDNAGSETNTASDSNFRFDYGANNVSGWLPDYGYNVGIVSDPEDLYQDLNDTGLMFAHIQAQVGDFQFTRAVLSVEYSLVPEPATMSLLALGGLALLRRKKKTTTI